MEELQTCQNCKKQFPESKINSHFSYCRRNIKKCSKCNQMIDINFQSEHEQQFHTNQSCQYCKKQFLPDQLTKHQNYCYLKPKYCEFCQLNIKTDQFTKHQITCGSRTKPCAKCSKNIILREYDFHIIDCPGKVIEPPQTTNNVRSPERKNIPNYKNQVPIQVPRRQVSQKNIQAGREFNTKPQISGPIQRRNQFSKKQEVISKGNQIIKNQYQMPKKPEFMNEQFNKQQYLNNIKQNYPNINTNIPAQYNRRPQIPINPKPSISNNNNVPNDINKKNQAKILSKPQTSNNRPSSYRHNQVPIQIKNQTKIQNNIKIDPKNQKNDIRNDPRYDFRNQRNDPRIGSRDMKDPRNNIQSNQKKIRQQKNRNEQKKQSIQQKYFDSNRNKPIEKKNIEKPREVPVPRYQESPERNHFYEEIPPIENSEDIELQKALYADYQARLQQQKFLKEAYLPKQYEQLNMVDLSQSMCRDLSNQQAIQSSLKSKQGKNNENKRR